ncbi:PaaI family thioesterase [Methylosinus sporium]|uniref:PaaI family thioesterase n=1 Tax=Methylosinus sporium TaxID=428 RepID=A0A549SD86_METSR|nr:MULTISPECIES: PaaI family thioesterase [Methylosinus]TRL25505.1 PaaI family thioesterase [Methylosinus sporium]
MSDQTRIHVGGALPLERLRSMSGLDVVRAMGEAALPVPPILLFFGFRPVEIEDGRVVFAATPDERHYNPLGTVHGGYIAALLDSTMGCAVHTTLPPGQLYTTLEFKVNFTRTITAGVDIHAEGNVLHRGRSVATAEARLYDARRRLLAHATTSCMIFAADREPNG